MEILGTEISEVNIEKIGNNCGLLTSLQSVFEKLHNLYSLSELAAHLDRASSSDLCHAEH